jgi:hypothetical protein
MEEQSTRIAVVRNETFKRWWSAPYNLENLGQFHFQIIADVQTLAYVEVYLRLLESDMKPEVQPGELRTLDARAFFDNDASDADFARNVELIALSRLWVLGAFELIRTLLSQVKRKKADHNDAIRDSLVGLKSRIAEVRTLLAKYERTGGKHGVLENAPFRPFHKAGYGWELPDGSVLVRSQIADELLGLFESMQSKRR